MKLKQGEDYTICYFAVVKVFPYHSSSCISGEVNRDYSTVEMHRDSPDDPTAAHTNTKPTPSCLSQIIPSNSGHHYLGCTLRVTSASPLS